MLKITNGKAYRNFTIYAMLHMHLSKYQLLNHILSNNDENVKTLRKFKLDEL